MSESNDRINSCIALLNANASPKAYQQLLEGYTRWADLAKASDLTHLRQLTALTLTVSYAGDTDLLANKEFARTPSLWGPVLAKAESAASMTSEIDALLDPIRNSIASPDHERLPDHSVTNANPPQLVQTNSDSSQRTSIPDLESATAEQSALLRLLMDSINKSLPGLVSSALRAQQSPPPLANQIPSPAQQIPSPANLANDANVTSRAKNLMESVMAMAAPNLSPQDPMHTPLRSRDQQQNPPQAVSPTQQTVAQPVQQFFLWPSAEDETPMVGSIPLSSRMPISVPVTTKKKNSFWAPRLMSDEAKSKSGKDLMEVPFPLMSEYFELAMRVCDLLDLQGDNFQDYVEYVRWVMKLRNNHQWDSVMRYDEAFRAEMELHPHYKWDRRPQELERLHLINRTHREGDAGSYAGSKRKATGNIAGVVCNNYNSDRCKAGTSCPRVHRCSICKKQGHPATKCNAKESPNSQPDQAFSQGRPGANRD